MWRSAPGLDESADEVGNTASVHVIAHRSSRIPAPRIEKVGRPETSARATTSDRDVPDAELVAPSARFDQCLPSSHTSTRRTPEQPFTRSVRSWELVSDVEAAAFAGRFACDFQSFDEDVPWRRAEVLREVLADAAACTWGWSGAGRQRADSPLPGRIYRRSETTVFAEVIVRATPYVRTAAAPDPDDYPEGEDSEWVEPPGTIGRSCAPAESDASWTACEPRWVRMTVPVTRAPEDGRLVVDPGLLTEPAGEQASER
ncbi:hypothetical protein [Pseudonocardia sp. ICBG601]|uniref:hypothetical protein n=1 Tax=Pseudonocardia sp. ICBG601 TaxID=2846759 RepID=UPI001CF61A10|nr:hypothetical protein [Pseudonocardia sp. ICBG601]